MVSVKLFPKSDEIGNDVGCDDDVVLNQRRHRWLFEVFNDFRCTDHRLAQACVLHVEAFEFSLFLRQQVEGGLVHFGRVGFVRCSRCIAAFFHFRGGFRACRFLRWFGRFVFNLRSSHLFGDLWGNGLGLGLLRSRRLGLGLGLLFGFSLGRGGVGRA